jgi:hypothetical protein
MAKITVRNEAFEGYNKPKKTPQHPTKSHAVLAKEGDKVKLIRFGQQGLQEAISQGMFSGFIKWSTCARTNISSKNF